MPTFTPGETFNDGEQVNAARLNNHVASATPLDGLIADLTEINASEADAADYLMILDSSESQLKKIKKSDFSAITNSVQINNVDGIGVDFPSSLASSINLGTYTDTISIGRAPSGIYPYTQNIDINSKDIWIQSHGLGEDGHIHLRSDNSLVLFDSKGFKYPTAVPKNSSSIIQIPSGNTSERTTLSFYQGEIVDYTATTADMAGIVRFNTENSVIEYHNGTSWDSILRQSDLKYKTYKRKYTYPGFSDWTLPPYQWENSTTITIPSGETWIYEWTYVIPKTHDSGSLYDKPKLAGYFVIYNDTTEIQAIPIVANYWVGPITIYASQKLTSLDTPTPRKFRVRIEKRDGEGGTGTLPAASGTVTLTIRPTSDDTFVNTYL